MTDRHSAPSGAPAPEGASGAPGAVPGAAARDRRGIVGEYVFASVCAALGLYAIVGAGFIRVPPGSASVLGPRFFPYFVGAILFVASVVVIVDIARGHRGQPDEGEDVDANAKTDWRTVLLLMLCFLSLLVLIELAGWPFAAAVLFGGAAITLGAKRWWVAVLIGLGLGIVTQLVFGVWLGLSLPAGPLLNWIPIFNG
ncbi:tripartite tricarboxylate transporter TctB family protein [Agromyces bauzanensis]